MYLLRLLKEERWLLLGFAALATLAALPPPPGLSPEGMRVLAIIAMALVFFVAEPLPLPGVALLIAVFQVLLRIGTPNEVAHAFMSDAVFFIMGALMISVAIVKQRLDRRIVLWLFRLTGPRVGPLVFGLVAVSALFSSFIGTYTMAAMMLPVGLTIVGMAKEETPEVQRLGALIMLAIAYGCSIGTQGTPSGGARNAIMLDYWQRLYGLKVSYTQWIIHAYPPMLLQIPFVAGVLLWTFRPEVRDLGPALRRLREELAERERLGRRDWLVLGVFMLTLLGWIVWGRALGLGTIALIGASLYLILGLVRWEDLNSGVNWGVVLLYAASISLGYQMKVTGAAAWLAGHFLRALGPLGLDHGLGLSAALSLLTVVISNSMTSGAAVAVLGPITLNLAALAGGGEGALLSAGFVTAISSTFAYLTIIAAPASTILYASGYLTARDLLRAGPRLLLISVIILFGTVALYWPLLGGM